MTSLRFHVKPRDVPPSVAARKLGLTEAAFREKLPELLGRKFPPPDPTTGHFDLEAIDRWQSARNPQLFGLTASNEAKDAAAVVRDRLRTMSGGRR